MATFFQSLQELTRTYVCASIGSADSLYRQLPGGEDSEFYKIASAFGQAAGRLFCNRDSYAPNPGVPGGQCEKLYNVRMVKSTPQPFPNPPQTSVFERTHYGPIGGLKVYRPSETYFPNGSDVSIICRGRPPAAPSPTPVEVKWASAPENGVQWAITGIFTVDGSPDNCGSLPAGPKPYDPNDFKFDGEVNYTNNDGLDVTVPVGVLIAPVKVDANFNFTIPVKFTFSPNFSFDPTFQYDIQANFNLGDGTIDFDPPVPTGDDPPAPRPPFDFDPDIDLDINEPAPPRPPDVPDSPTKPDTDESAAVIRGVIVTTVGYELDTKVGVLYQDGQPDVYYPDLGLVSFQIRTRNGTAWTEDLKVKNKQQFIPCEWIGGAIDVRATPRQGVQFNVTPVYGQPSSEV